MWTLLATLPPAMIYLWLGDAPASMLRAAIMLLFLAFYFLRAAPTPHLIFCAPPCSVSAWPSPLSVLDTGLQLSVLCVAVIGMSLPWLRVLALSRTQRHQRSRPKIWGQGLRQRLRRARWVLARIFLVSLCIQVALLPLNMLLFNNAGHSFWLNVPGRSWPICWCCPPPC